jgi:hypothetical protein
MTCPPEHPADAQAQTALHAALQQFQEQLATSHAWLADSIESLRAEIAQLAQRIEPAGPPAAAGNTPALAAATNETMAAVPYAIDPAPVPFVLAPPATAPAEPAYGEVLDELLLGPELGSPDTSGPSRRELIRQLRQGDQAALNLIGQIMTFRGAGPERRAQLLKEIGEAYYRWRGPAAQMPDPFRDRLIQWLSGACEASGLPIAVELVQVGDRYDSKKHHARQRGIEVAAVEGWVVLRGDGRVYTKANVELR